MAESLTFMSEVVSDCVRHDGILAVALNYMVDGLISNFYFFPLPFQ